MYSIYLVFPNHTEIKTAEISVALLPAIRAADAMYMAIRGVAHVTVWNEQSKQVAYSTDSTVTIGE